MGRALSRLRSKGVLIIGNGQSTSTHRSQSDAEQFTKALNSVCTSLDFSKRGTDLENWRNAMPRARMVHMREEHLLPLLVAAAAAENEPGVAVANLWSGSLGLTHFRFGDVTVAKAAKAGTACPDASRAGNGKVSFESEAL